MAGRSGLAARIGALLDGSQRRGPAGALLVAAAGAWHLLRGRRDPAVKTMFSMALWLLLVLAPIQALVGDQHGLNTRKYQPAKIAANSSSANMALRNTRDR